MNFQEDLEEIKQSQACEEEGDAFFMKELSPIRAPCCESLEAPISAAVESIRALGNTNNPQIKKLFSYQGSNEPQNKSLEMTNKVSGIVAGTPNSRQWIKQPEIKAKVLGT